jgi:hypothetical protein
MTLLLIQARSGKVLKRRFGHGDPHGVHQPQADYTEDAGISAQWR